MENVKEALRIVGDADENSLLTGHKDIVLVLGCTGAGKSTLTQFIGSNKCNLTAEKVGNTHLIVDVEQHRINSSIMSHTIYPEFVFDQTHNTAFYDCGGFNDTRSAAHDIASQYLIKRIIDYADRIKIILVIAYQSVQEGVDREGLLQLLRHVVTLIKDVDKFKSSIALIVNKVYELEEVELGAFRQIGTERIINTVGEFLTKVKDVFPAIKTETGHYYSDEYNELVVRLINILLIKDDNDVHQRIGIFRKPTKPGSLNEQYELQQCKSQISNVIFENIKFTAKENDDFGYTISDAAKNQIHEIVEVLNETFSNLTAFDKEFSSHLTSLEQENQNDLYKISDIIFKVNKMLEVFIEEITDYCSPLKFYQKFKSILAKNNLQSLQHCLSAQLKAAEYFDFLQVISKAKLTLGTFSWTKQLSLIKSYAQAQHDWIMFLIAMFEKLSAYDIDKFASEIGDYGKFVEFVDNLISLTAIDYKFNLPVDETKTKMFRNVLAQTLEHDIKYSTVDGVLKITGFNLRLSEVPKEILNANSVRNIQIFSLNKLFIDQDLCEMGDRINLVIVAPTWEVVGNHEINISGSDGKRYVKTAKCGTYPGGSGSNGRVGRNGIDAGNCMMVGRSFINGKALRIVANGGNGGQGQHGGFGGQGETGRDAESVDCEENLPSGTFIENHEDDGGWTLLGRVVTLGANSQNIKTRYKIPGNNGLDGGTGGEGGHGGAAGRCGSVNVIATDHRSEFMVSRKVGTQGLDGSIGSTGRKGLDGASFIFNSEKKISTSVFFLPMKPTNIWKKIRKNPSNNLATITNSSTKPYVPTRESAWNVDEVNDEELDVVEVIEDYFDDSYDVFCKRSVTEYEQYVANNAESSLNYGELSRFVIEINARSCG